MLTGPFTVGPTTAQPACIGCDDICEESFSLANTPGDKSTSAIL